MEITDILQPEGVICGLKASGKKQVLQELARQATAVTGISEKRIFETLLERERLGTTGVGNGIAVPHGKLSEAGQLHGVFARLEKTVDFNAIDEQPVDLVFMLLAPQAASADHLKALARVSRVLRDASTCEKLRGAKTADGLYLLLIESEAQAV